MDITEKLSQKIGAFPVWVWGALVAGIGLVAYFMYGRNSNAPAGVTAGAGLDPIGYQTSGMSGAVDNPNTALAPTESNSSWLSKVSKMVADAGAQSPSAVYAGLFKWLTGQDISEQERMWVDDALKRMGTPPEGTQGISNVIKPTVVADPTPPKPTPATPSKKGYYTNVLVRQGVAGVRHAVYGTKWGIQTVNANGSKTWHPIGRQASANAEAKKIGNFALLSEAAFNAKAKER